MEGWQASRHLPDLVVGREMAFPLLANQVFLTAEVFGRGHLMFLVCSFFLYFVREGNRAHGFFAMGFSRSVPVS